MPDISMCPGGLCPLKKDCYRYRAFPNKYLWQSWVCPPKVNNPDEECDLFVPFDEKNDNVRPMEEI